MTPRRMLFAGDISSQSTGVNLIAPTGSRISLSAGAYQAFPALIADDTGDNLRLMYRYSAAHNSYDSKIDQRISTDGGATWPGGGTTIQSAGAPNDCRDPALIKTGTDRYILAHHTVVPYNSSNVNAYVNYSDDGSFTPLSTYTLPTSYSGPIKSAVSSPFILDGTDVVLPGYAEDGGDPSMAIMWTSTDDGATFGSPVIIASHATRDYVEPQLRILASGRWLCLMRSESNHHTWRTYSDDGGSTWSTPADVNAMTGRPDFIEYRNGRILQVGRYNTSSDSPPYYTVSLDDGATWSTPAEVDPGETKLHMYASFVKTADGAVTMAYALESSSTFCGVYVRYFAD